MRLLVVEDEIKTGDYLRQGLAEAGFQVSLVRNGLDGHHLAMTESFDLIVLDVMLPDVDGWRIVQSLREAGRQTPVLFLSARDSVDDRVKGLELGADDYVNKPVRPLVLLARIRALLRRSGESDSSAAPSRLEFGELVVDNDRREAWLRGELIELTGASGGGRAVDVQVTRLRRKIEQNPKLPRYLRTVRGKGYVLRPD